MIEFLIRWLRASHKGYGIALCGLQLASKWYADERTLITNLVEDMIVLLDLVDQPSKLSGIHLNVSKYKITVFIHNLQAIRHKRGRDVTLQPGGQPHRFPYSRRTPSKGLPRQIPHYLPMPGRPWWT